MSVLKSSKETFEFNLKDMKKLICADLGVSEDKVNVDYKMSDVSDDRFERSPRYEVSKIEVTVDRT